MSLTDMLEASISAEPPTTEQISGGPDVALENVNQMEVDSSLPETSSAELTANGAGQGAKEQHLPAIETSAAEPTSTSATQLAGQAAVTTKDTEDQAPAAAIATTAKPLCGICNKEIGKYKCARCQLPFCCVACGKTHRENHPPDPEPSAKPATSSEGPEPRDNGPAEPFSFLNDSEQLRYLFRRYPNLPKQLLAIGAETDPPAEAQPGTIKEAILARAAAASKPKKDQWNHDVGIKKGKDALRKARRAHGDDGEGIREYTELIKHLTSQQEARAKEAEQMIQQQTAQQDADIIRRLMESEGRG